MKYIVEKNNSNPKILELQADNTYKVIAFAAGGDNLNNIKILCDQANLATRDNL